VTLLQRPSLVSSDIVRALRCSQKPAPAPAPAPAAAPAPSASPAPTAAAPSTPAAASASGAAATSTPGSQFVTAEGLQALTSMGFPENECRAALAAAMGNPDLAYEFLLTGIPTTSPAAAHAGAPPAGAAPSGAVTIDALRRHPQFNMLKQLVQQNPGALSQVLDLIGQQSPELLAAIHANNDAFIAMMNEPIVDTPPPAPTSAAAAPAAPPAGGNPMGSPAAMMQMLAALPSAQRAQFAAQMGMQPQQLEAMMQMMASIPPEQMEQIMGQAGMGGGGGMGGADPPGVIRLTEEEMAAVNRLMALGFSQQQAAQAYLACDKNETLAANLLFEGGWGDEGDDMGGYGGHDHDGDDNMYN
jgi:UV excision repair protein RAD23